MIPVKGRVPVVWDAATAAHVTERLQAIERALSGARPVYATPASPTFGAGSGVVAGAVAGSQNITETTNTTITNTTVVQDGWARKFLLMGA